ncbi:MAG: hypothetical protein AAGG50_02345 [Bacteroidota bacterium]
MVSLFRTVAIAFCVLLAGSAFPAQAQEALRVTGPATPLVGSEAAPFGHARWAPDGTRLAVTRPGYDGLWVVNANGDALTQLTDEASAGYGAAWAPDGSALLARVARYDDRFRSDAVKVFDLATSEVRALTDYRASLPMLPRWQSGAAVVLVDEEATEALASGLTVDAARDVAQTVYAEHPQSGLVVVRPDGSRSRYLADQRVINAVASPDGQRVAFEVMGGDLHVMNADGSGLTSLGRGHRPTWAPDGDWVAFMRTEDNGYFFTAADLYAARPDGSATIQLTATPDRLEMNPAWAPDGTALAFDDNAGTVYVLTIED